MPNWCYNKLTIEGDEKAIEAVEERLASGERRLSFATIAKMPDELKGIVSGGGTIDGVRVNIWREVGDKQVAISKEEEAALKENFGATNWYDWNVNNWGTKWDVGDGVDVDSYGGWIEYRFDTAWGPPDIFIDKLREAYPDLEIELRYRLEDDEEYPHVL